MWRGWSSSFSFYKPGTRRQRVASLQRNDIAPKNLNGEDKNGQLDRDVELDEQGSTGKLLCGRLGRV